MSQNKKSIVSIVMGSQSDYKTMKLSAKVLKSLKIQYEIKIVSAHRTPKRMYKFAKNTKKNSISVIIAGAGGLRTSRNDCFFNIFACNWGSNESKNLRVG